MPIASRCWSRWVQDFRVDMDDFAAKLDGADAVLISHMRGQTSDMDAIMALADARGLPVVEDAAHSLGTTWGGRKIGTLGKIGCFSFQSYKLVNAGEGGMFITDDADLAARAVIMSGAYEHNWKKHPGLQNSYMLWQNKLPLYNLRMQNLSAAVIRPQLPEVAGRVARGRAGHDRVAERLNESPWLSVPPALGPEERAPDSIQFNLTGEWTDDEARRLPVGREAARRFGAGLRPVRGQRPRLLELAVPRRSAGAAEDPRDADARLRRAPADPADRGLSWISLPRRWSPRRGM